MFNSTIFDVVFWTRFRISCHQSLYERINGGSLVDN